MRVTGSFRIALLLLLGLGSRSGWAISTPVAQYEFNNTLASSAVGAPALIATDPLGLSGFVVDTVFGNSKPVWTFGGAASPAANRGWSEAVEVQISRLGVFQGS